MVSENNAVLRATRNISYSSDVAHSSTVRQRETQMSTIYIPFSKAVPWFYRGIYTTLFLPMLSQILLSDGHNTITTTVG